MTLSVDGLQAALAEWTEVIFLECLTFEHTDLSAPIRLVNNTEDLVRTAGTFTAFPLVATLYEQSDEAIGSAKITASNVDQRLIEELRAISEPKPEVTYELVTAAEPNTIEHGPIKFKILGFVADAASLSFTLSFSLDFLNEGFPKGLFSPGNSE